MRTKGKIERLNRTIEQELLQGLPGWTGGPRDVRGRLVEQTRWTLGRFVAVFAEWVDRYNTRRGHTALAGRTPLEVWRSDPTAVRALEHQQARWMLLARRTKVVQKDGIHHNSDVYFADELWGMVGDGRGGGRGRAHATRPAVDRGVSQRRLARDRPPFRRA
jgi:putative transposase